MYVEVEVSSAKRKKWADIAMTSPLERSSSLSIHMIGARGPTARYTDLVSLRGRLLGGHQANTVDHQSPKMAQQPSAILVPPTRLL